MTYFLSFRVETTGITNIAEIFKYQETDFYDLRFVKELNFDYKYNPYDKIYILNFEPIYFVEQFHPTYKDKVVISNFPIKHFKVKGHLLLHNIRLGAIELIYTTKVKGYVLERDYEKLHKFAVKEYINKTGSKQIPKNYLMLREEDEITIYLCNSLEFNDALWNFLENNEYIILWELI